MVTVICTFEIVIFLRIILKLIQNDRSEKEIKKIFSEYCYLKNPVIQHSLDFVFFIDLRRDFFFFFIFWNISKRLRKSFYNFALTEKADFKYFCMTRSLVLKYAKHCTPLFTQYTTSCTTLLTQRSTSCAMHN